MKAQGDRFTKGKPGIYAGAIGNFLLMVIKIVGGFLGHSEALLADGVHNATDFLGVVAVFLGLRSANRPADQDHPYGHQKAESIAQKIVAILLLLAGFELLITSIKSLYVGVHTTPKLYTLWIMIFSLAVKYGLYSYNRSLGKKLNSKALLAGAQDHLSDTYASFAAIVGIVLARLGFLWADPLAGGMVAILVLKVGWEMVTGAIDDLMDKFDDVQLVKAIKAAGAKIPGVEEVQNIKGRYMGSEIILDVEIAVRGDLTVIEGHTIAHRFIEGIKKEFPQLLDIHVHVNPAAPKEQPS